LEISKLVLYVGCRKIITVHVQVSKVSVILVGVSVGIVNKIIVSFILFGPQPVAICIIEPRVDAETLVISVSFATLCKEQLGFFVLAFLIIRDSPALERGYIDGRPVSRGLEAGAAKGYTVDKVFAVGRDLVSAAQTTLPAVTSIQGPNAVARKRSANCDTNQRAYE
jgi:hypothetical protein